MPLMKHSSLPGPAKFASMPLRLANQYLVLPSFSKPATSVYKSLNDATRQIVIGCTSGFVVSPTSYPNPEGSHQ
jgi:hypothetical protein